MKINRNRGIGIIKYPAGKNLSETRGKLIGIGEVNYDGKRYFVRSKGTGVTPGPEPEPIAPNTLRFRFSNSETDPRRIRNDGTWTKIVDSDFNDWDWTSDIAEDWYGQFSNSLTTTLDPDIQIIAGNTSDITNMARLFNGCTGLTSVQLFDTSNVTRMDYMFNECTNLVSVPLFDTHSVTTMSNTFNRCRSLTSVPLFDTHNVTDMTFMLYFCDKLTEIPPFDTSNVTMMYGMFAYCSNITTVPLFNTTNVTSMTTMFDRCTSLTSVPLFNTTNVKSMISMFEACTSLTSVPLFNTTNVTSMNSMFNGCTSLTSVPQFDVHNVSNMRTMFNNCTSLTSVPLFNVSGDIDRVNEMLKGCVNVESGALALYQALSHYEPRYHDNTFTNCGISTESGRAELEQIPESWGGLKSETAGLTPIYLTPGSGSTDWTTFVEEYNINDPYSSWFIQDNPWARDAIDTGMTKAFYVSATGWGARGGNMYLEFDELHTSVTFIVKPVSYMTSDFSIQYRMGWGGTIYTSELISNPDPSDNTKYLTVTLPFDEPTNRCIIFPKLILPSGASTTAAWTLGMKAMD